MKKNPAGELSPFRLEKGVKIISSVTPVVKGSDLRKIRTEAGLRTKDMAAAAGVKTRKTYENWEKGFGTPNVNQFLAMVRECGLSPSVFLTQLAANLEK